MLLKVGGAFDDGGNVPFWTPVRSPSPQDVRRTYHQGGGQPDGPRIFKASEPRVGPNNKEVSKSSSVLPLEDVGPSHIEEGRDSSWKKAL